MSTVSRLTDDRLQPSLNLSTPFPTLPCSRPSPPPNTPARHVEVNFRNDIPHISSTTHSVFSLYRYPAKFIPQAVAFAIERHATQGMRIIDPFAGSGTTGLVARLYGLDYELWDLNPLLEVIHGAAVLPPFAVDVDACLQQIRASQHEWLPEWGNLKYWYPEQSLTLLERAWGYYHSLQDEHLKKLLTSPLLKATKLFSYNDAQKQSLTRSQRSIARVDALLQGNFVEQFENTLRKEIVKSARKLHEYQSLGGHNHPVNARTRAGIDTLSTSQTLNPQERWDMLITSPPYLQALQYIRCTKQDLFWLGYTEEQVRNLSRHELPYRKIEPRAIYSSTYHAYRQEIHEPHLLKTYDQYFYAVLEVLSNIAARISETLCILVGRATVRGVSIPIDQIFAEHFTHLGWIHEFTYIDTIKARIMFRAKTNPATGIEDKRMPAEYMVILRRHNP